MLETSNEKKVDSLDLTIDCIDLVFKHFLGQYTFTNVLNSNMKSHIHRTIAKTLENLVDVKLFNSARITHFQADNGSDLSINIELIPTYSWAIDSFMIHDNLPNSFDINLGVKQLNIKRTLNYNLSEFSGLSGQTSLNNRKATYTNLSSEHAKRILSNLINQYIILYMEHHSVQVEQVIKNILNDLRELKILNEAEFTNCYTQDKEAQYFKVKLGIDPFFVSVLSEYAIRIEENSMMELV